MSEVLRFTSIKDLQSHTEKFPEAYFLLYLMQYWTMRTESNEVLQILDTEGILSAPLVKAAQTLLLEIPDDDEFWQQVLWQINHDAMARVAPFFSDEYYALMEADGGEGNNFTLARSIGMYLELLNAEKQLFYLLPSGQVAVVGTATSANAAAVQKLVGHLEKPLLVFDKNPAPLKSDLDENTWPTQADALQLPLPDGLLSVVFADFLVNCMTPDLWQPLLGELKRVLAPGGVICLSVMIADSEVAEELGSGKPAGVFFRKSQGVVREPYLVPFRQQWWQLLKQQGLEVQAMAIEAREVVQLFNCYFVLSVAS